jgi:hypothetical protein
VLWVLAPALVLAPDAPRRQVRAPAGRELANGQVRLRGLRAPAPALAPAPAAPRHTRAPQARARRVRPRGRRPRPPPRPRSPAGAVHATHARLRRGPGPTRAVTEPGQGAAAPATAAAIYRARAGGPAGASDAAENATDAVRAARRRGVLVRARGPPRGRTTAVRRRQAARRGDRQALPRPRRVRDPSQSPRPASTDPAPAARRTKPTRTPRAPPPSAPRRRRTRTSRAL